MRVSATQLLRGNHAVCYLFGADDDAIQANAERLLDQGDDALPRVRADCDELDRIEGAWRNRALFGPSGCIGMVRNAGAASPKQGEQLLRMAQNVPEGSRLILCAGGAAWKKALHKKLLAHPEVACCEFAVPTPASFRCWLQEEAHSFGLELDAQTLDEGAERLCGMQQAATQWLQRLAWYAEDSRATIGWNEASALLGERAPAELEAWCHAVASKSGDALPLQRRLIEDQRIAPVQMISWLATRMRQITLFRWHQSRRGGGSPAQAAQLFGEARKQVPREASNWSGGDIAPLLSRIHQAEQKLKGSSLEQDAVVLERLVRELIS